MGRASRIFFALIALAVVGLAIRPVLAAMPRHPKTTLDLRAAADKASKTPPQRKVRVLIVPGHEPNFGGTSYRGLMERDLAVEMARGLKRLLDADGRYETRLSRDEKNWDPAIAAYFSSRWDEIGRWREESREAFRSRVASGAVKKPVVHVGHNKAPNDVAVRLYGITKWANENDIDLMLHVHFDRDRSSSNARTGFSIFVPSPEYGNGRATRAVAEKVAPRLAAFDPIADLTAVARAGGIVDDPQLIAVGQNDTADPASMVIEYAFIYEQRMRTPAVRALALEDMAYQTFLGMDDFFFGGKAAAKRPFATTVLPRAWKVPARGTAAAPADVYALQTALTADGLYPPPGKSKNACPRNGMFGPCTRTALRAFQKKHDIAGESGVLGAKTVEKLNEVFGK